MASPADHVMLSLSKNEAIVLFEFVSRFSEQRQLNIANQAKQRVLWDICSMLEKQLAEPLSPEYSSLLARARETVRDEIPG